MSSATHRVARDARDALSIGAMLETLS